MAFELPALPYSFGELEPHIDARTMEIHHDRHHQAYVNNLNNAIKDTEAENLSIEEICLKISKYPVAVRNNGGGHYNHSLFWSILSAKGGIPEGKMMDAIQNDLGSYESFKEEFSKAAATRFGSGWAWLSVDKKGKLCVCSTANQDNPLMDVVDCQGTPILGLDVWEHAYYLKYQNKRPDYIEAFFSIINWDEVTKNYENAMKAVKA